MCLGLRGALIRGGSDYQSMAEAYQDVREGFGFSNLECLGFRSSGFVALMLEQF